MTQVIKFRLDHAPADSPDDCVNRVLDWYCRLSIHNQIEDFTVDYASSRSTYLRLHVRDTPSPLYFLEERFDLGEGRWFSLSTVGLKTHLAKV